jgi:hypothetical protein
MTTNELIHSLQVRGVRLTLVGGRLAVLPRGRLTEADRAAIRAHKAELLRLLAEAEHTVRTEGMVPDSRHPLIPYAVREKIEVIEAEARRLGWPPELLWNAGFWDRPRGLAALLNPEDEIVEVTPECIGILKHRRDLLPFRRHVA